MWTYNFLRRHLPERAAFFVTAIWFGLLIALVIHTAFEPQADFRYANF